MDIPGMAINEIIIRTLHESAQCKDKLETEESGREVARLQGSVAGYRMFLSFLAAEFHLPQSVLEYTGDEGFEAPKLGDDQLISYRIDIADLKLSDAWVKVLARIEENTLKLKNFLLFSAEKSRDLDYSQGQFKATVFYENFFTAIENETARREKEAAERAKSPGLFDDESNITVFKKPEINREAMQ
jgi:hypothetical protein